MANEQPMYNDADHQLIEDFLEGILSEEDKKIVETRLESDADFATQFQLHQDIEGILDTSEKQSLKQDWATLMEEAEEEMKLEEGKSPLKVATKTTAKKQSKSSLGWMRIAAAILVFLIPAFLYFGGIFDASQANPQELAMQHFEAPDNIALAMRGTENQITTQQELAKKLYAQKKYQNALKILEQLPLQDSIVNVSQIYFSMGVCHYLLGEYAEASQDLLEVNEQEGIKAKANWYLALTYLQQNELVKAKQLFKEIAEKDASKKRKKRAKQILEELK